MKFRLVEERIDYNANPQGKNEEDCAIRALSLAYDMRYNAVKSELNSIATKNKSKFNYIDTINTFIEKHGFRKYINNEDGNSSVDDVDDFARKNRHGVYVVYCSNKTKQENSNSFHLVAVINGKIYDTWDSSNYYVLGAWDIKSHNRTVNNIKTDEQLYKIDESDVITLSEDLFKKFDNLICNKWIDEEYLDKKGLPSINTLIFEFNNHPVLANRIDEYITENIIDKNISSVLYEDLLDEVNELCYNYANDYLKGRVTCLNEKFYTELSRDKHFEKHGQEFQPPYSTPEEYEEAADYIAKNYRKAQSPFNDNAYIVGYITKSGRYLVYNKMNNELLAFEYDPKEQNHIIISYYITGATRFNDIRDGKVDDDYTFDREFPHVTQLQNAEIRDITKKEKEKQKKLEAEKQKEANRKRYEKRVKKFKK